MQAALPTPATEDLKTIWADRAIFPTRDDERYYMAQQLYYALDLDWRIPAHKDHVYAIVDKHIGPPRRVKETND